jgi:fructokinase
MAGALAGAPQGALLGALLGAIEGGGSKFLCAVGSAPDAIVARCRIPTSTPEQTLAAVAAFFAPYRAQLAALGICCFGPLELDPAAGEAFGGLLETPKLGWSRAPVRARLAAELQLPIAIDTDVNGAALAEQQLGAARDVDPVVYITVGTGVGVGVVIGNEPLHGLMHPELGHMRAYDPGFAGSCPFHGSCVEGLVSAPALRARVGCEPESLTDDHPVWDSTVRTLGALLHTVVLAYAPRRIVLGGGVLSRPSLLPRLRSELVRSLAGYVPRSELGPAGMDSYLVAAQLGQEAGLAGGFCLASRLLAR